MKQSVYESLLQRMRRYQRNYRTRRQLLQLDAAALKDIGISRAEALAEARKPFWVNNTVNRTQRITPVQMSAGAMVCGCSVMTLMWFF